MTYAQPSLSQAAARIVIAVAVLAPLTVIDSRAQAPIIQPGAPGEPSRTISAEDAADLASILESAFPDKAAGTAPVDA